MTKPLFKARKVTPTLIFTGSIVRKRLLKTPRSRLNLSAILKKMAHNVTRNIKDKKLNPMN
jgi:hypothetical protein